MTSFLAANWIWILLIGGFLFMHFGHRHGGHMGGGMGGCGGGHTDHQAENHERHDHETVTGDADRHAAPSGVAQSEDGHGDDRSAPTPSRGHRGC
ncbi:MAG: hypothetical protein ACYCST_15490 [Acidimicrobiales bacterium]